MIIRFAITMIFYVLVARWGYNEIGMVYPDALPLIDASLERISIPTHDQWSKDAIHNWVDHVASTVESVKDEDNRGIMSLASLLNLQSEGLDISDVNLRNDVFSFNSGEDRGSRRRVVERGSLFKPMNGKSYKSIEQGMLDGSEDNNVLDELLEEMNVQF